MSVALAKHVGFTEDQIGLIKRTICQGSTNDELQLFLHQCERTGLDPFARQIHAVKRKSKDENGAWVEKMAIQVGIDGFRLIADRTGEANGQDGPFWSDGELYPVYDKEGKEIDKRLRWIDAWPLATAPKLAKVVVHRKGHAHPYSGVARYASYVQLRAIWENRQKVGEEPNRMWSTMPDVMLAKCAEALALRKAFPQELSGLYTADEMGQAENETPPKALPAPELAGPDMHPAPSHAANRAQTASSVCRAMEAATTLEELRLAYNLTPGDFLKVKDEHTAAIAKAKDARKLGILRDEVDRLADELNWSAQDLTLAEDQAGINDPLTADAAQLGRLVDILKTELEHAAA